MDAATVKQFFTDFDETKAQLVADLCNGEIVIDPFNVDERFPKTAAWCRQCHNPPSQNELVLAALDDVLEGFGTEAIRDPDDSDNIIATYVNMGDSYNATIVFDEEDETYVLSTWADWYEGWINSQNEENGTIQCGWCSHLTPNADGTEDDDGNEQSWSDTICEQCGNYVDGKPGPGNDASGHKKT